MKKCDFLSAEALLQAEIFGDGSGGGSSNIIDAYDWFVINDYGLLITNYAYYDYTLQKGVYYFEFDATGTSPEIQIDNNVAGNDCVFFDFVSSNDTATESSKKISFTATIGERIVIGGIFGYSSR